MKLYIPICRVKIASESRALEATSNAMADFVVNNGSPDSKIFESAALNFFLASEARFSKMVIFLGIAHS